MNYPSFEEVKDNALQHIDALNKGRRVTLKDIVDKEIWQRLRWSRQKEYDVMFKDFISESANNIPLEVFKLAIFPGCGSPFISYLKKPTEKDKKTKKSRGANNAKDISSPDLCMLDSAKVNDAKAIEKNKDTAPSDNRESAKSAKQTSVMSNDEFIAKYKDITLPKGYELGKDGVFKLNGDEKNLIAESPIIVPAQSRDINSEGWQIMIAFLDMDGNERKLLVNRADLADAQGGIIRQLENSGCCCVPGQEREIKSYLRLSRPLNRLRRTRRAGWLDSRKEMVFVMPNQIIGEVEPEPGKDNGKTERLVFAPTTTHPCHKNILSRGKLESWKTHVAAKAKGNPLLIFSVCYSLSGPLLRYLNVEPGGAHFFGPSSSGKSTALQMAGSVWGNSASAAQSGASSFIQQWNTTVNALESLAEAHNDMVLILDELGQCSDNSFAKVAYDLANGQGKTRMSNSAQAQSVATWRVPFLSSGEISIRRQIERNGGIVKTGQLLRVIDIPTGDGIIVNSGDQASGDYVNDIKVNCGKFYGTAGPAFVKALIDYQLLTDKENRIGVKEMHDAYTYDLLPDKYLQERERVVRRLAVAVVAGELAIQEGILPFSLNEAQAACKHVVDLWIDASSALTDAMRGVVALRDFISGNKGRFVNHDAKTKLCYEVPGYRFIDKPHGLDLYLFTDAGFYAACAQASPMDVARELRRLKLLHQNNDEKNKALLVVDGRRQSFFAVKADILGKPLAAEELRRQGTVVRRLASPPRG